MKFLLHTCCAPCLVTFITGFKNENLRPDLYWYNLNIHPFTEYRFRKDSLIAFAKDEGLELIIEDEYGLRQFIRGTYSPDGTIDDNRCRFCYHSRLEKTVKTAVEKQYDVFSTTLLASPYQKHEMIKQICEKLASQYNIDFYYKDYRSGYREGQNKARARGCYMQKYCGCIFSEEERYLNVL